MVMVTTYTWGTDEGTCVFCTRRGGEMFGCEFEDGLRGTFCRACFTRALRLRGAPAGQEATKAAGGGGTPAAGNGAAAARPQLSAGT